MAFGQPPAEFNVGLETVRILLADQFPGLADLPIEVADAGWDNAMFRLGPDLAIRLPRRKEALACIQAEINWLTSLAPRVPLAIPAPIHVGAPTPFFPAPWTIVPWLPGNPADTNPPNPTEAETLANFFRALHTPAPPDAPINEFRGVPLQEMQVRRHLSDNPIEPYLTPYQIEMWKLSLENPYKDAPVWLHGDLHPLNALTTNGQFSAILDWGDLTSGDPACDLARFYMFFNDPNAIQSATSDPETIRRAQGWALHFGVTHLLHGEHGQPRHGEIGRQTLENLEQAPLMY